MGESDYTQNADNREMDRSGSGSVQPYVDRNEEPYPETNQRNAGRQYSGPQMNRKAYDDQRQDRSGQRWDYNEPYREQRQTDYRQNSYENYDQRNRGSQYGQSCDPRDNYRQYDNYNYGPTIGSYPQNQPQDDGSVGWGILGFFIPLVGLILFLVWKNEKPKSAKAAGTGALISVCIYAALVVLWIILISVGIAAAA